MKKIIHIITGLNNGGAEGVLYRLCQYDKKNEHIVISLSDKGKYGSLLEKNNIKVHCLNMQRNRISLVSLWWLFTFLRQQKPNIVQTWMYHADLIGGVFAKLAGIKSVFWNVRHSTLEPGKSKRSTIWISKACTYISSWVPNKIVYCAYESKVVHETLGYTPSKAEIIGNGYDLSHFNVDITARTSFRSEVGVTNEDILVGMIGRFDPQKDHANILRALSLVKKTGYTFKLVLIGQGMDSHNQSLLNLIRENQLKEHVTLLSQREDIPTVMNGIDLHVLSSSFGEAFPNVLAEAMACGTPCITTNVGDAALIVDRTGWAVPPKQHQALANSIIEAINEKETNEQAWLQRKKDCRRRIVANFSIEKMVSRYHQVWFNK